MSCVVSCVVRLKWSFWLAVGVLVSSSYQGVAGYAYHYTKKSTWIIQLLGRAVTESRPRPPVHHDTTHGVAAVQILINRRQCVIDCVLQYSAALPQVGCTHDSFIFVNNRLWVSFSSTQYSSFVVRLRFLVLREARALWRKKKKN